MTDMINQIGINAKKAARILAKTSSEQKNHAIQAMSKYVLANKKIILEAIFRVPLFRIKKIFKFI